jgi:predicted HTH domain antitoxin
VLDLAKARLMQVVAARLPKEVASEIEQIALHDKVDRSTVIARAADEYIKEWKTRTAVKLYEEGGVTVGKAASLAGLSIWEFLEELVRRRIPVQYSAEEFMADFQAALAE